MEHLFSRLPAAVLYSLSDFLHGFDAAGLAATCRSVATVYADECRKRRDARWIVWVMHTTRFAAISPALARIFELRNPDLTGGACGPTIQIQTADDEVLPTIDRAIQARITSRMDMAGPELHVGLDMFPEPEKIIQHRLASCEKKALDELTQPYRALAESASDLDDLVEDTVYRFKGKLAFVRAINARRCGDLATAFNWNTGSFRDVCYRGRGGESIPSLEGAEELQPNDDLRDPILTVVHRHGDALYGPGWAPGDWYGMPDKRMTPADPTKEELVERTEPHRNPYVLESILSELPKPEEPPDFTLNRNELPQALSLEELLRLADRCRATAPDDPENPEENPEYSRLVVAIARDCLLDHLREPGPAPRTGAGVFDWLLRVARSLLAQYAEAGLSRKDAADIAFYCFYQSHHGIETRLPRRLVPEPVDAKGPLPFYVFTSMGIFRFVPLRDLEVAYDAVPFTDRRQKYQNEALSATEHDSVEIKYEE